MSWEEYARVTGTTVDQVKAVIQELADTGVCTLASDLHQTNPAHFASSEV
jgi:predicted transcriptional regulator